jgi:hypothetical protein
MACATEDESPKVRKIRTMALENMILFAWCQIKGMSVNEVVWKECGLEKEMERHQVGELRGALGDEKQERWKGEGVRRRAIERPCL